MGWSKRSNSQIMELAKSSEAVEPLPITAICIVADKNKCPKGFQAVTKAGDDGSDADLWRESAFSFFSRPVRYLAISRDVPEPIVKGVMSFSVICDITVVKDSDPIPHGFVPIDYTSDTAEKALRKRFICIKTCPRDTAVDAVGEVVVLNKSKKTPKGFSSAGEVDGAHIVFRVVTIPATFGMQHSVSAQNLATNNPSDLGIYPNLGHGYGASTPANLNQQTYRPGVTKDDFTIKDVNGFLLVESVIPGAGTPIKGIDGVPFKIHPSYDKSSRTDENLLTSVPFDISRLDTPEFNYNFSTENMILSS